MEPEIGHPERTHVVGNLQGRQQMNRFVIVRGILAIGADDGHGSQASQDAERDDDGKRDQTGARVHQLVANLNLHGAILPQAGLIV